MAHEFKIKNGAIISGSITGITEPTTENSAKMASTAWVRAFLAAGVSKIQHTVKLGETMSTGTPVFVPLAQDSGTNMTVMKASNASEGTSSKTMGLIATGGVAGDLVQVITEGLLEGLDTSTATKGDPVWLGPTGTLIFGLTNKPSAPAHLVFIGIVTRSQANNGEVFVKVQNGFELDELHNVALSSAANNEGLFYEVSAGVGLWKNKTIAAALGYTPANDSSVVHIEGAETINGQKTFTSTVYTTSTLSINNGTLVGNNIVSMRANPTGGQFRIEKSDGSLSAYPFYVGVDGTALAYYYNASGALKVLLHTNGTSYFGNSLSIGYATYAATSYMLDVNGTANIVGALSGTSATFSVGINTNRSSATGSNPFIWNTAGVSDWFLGSSPLGTSTSDLSLYSYGTSSVVLNIARSTGAATFSSSIAAGGIVTAPSQFQLSGSSLPTGLNLGVGGNTPLLEFHANFRNSQNTTYRGGELRIDTRDGQSLFSFLSRAAGSTVDNFLLSLSEAGQLKLTTYTSATSYSGTAAGYLAFDSSGNVITVAGVSGTDSTKLPLAGGTMTGALVVAAGDRGFEVNASGGISLYSNEINAGALGGTGTIYMGWRRTTQVNVGVPMVLSSSISATTGSFSGPVTITGNGSYLGDWGYKTLELNDTSGYAGIFFKNGANVWITRRNGADNAMDWAYSTDATSQGVGTFTHKMRLASDEWWVSTYPNYKMRIVGGDVIESLNGTSATTLYLQYHSNTGGNVNIAASKFIFENANNRLYFSKTSGTLISHGSMTDAIGYNASYGTYIGSPVGGATYYLYANGSFYDNGTVRTLLHSGNYSSYAVPLAGGTMSGILYSTYNTATGRANLGFNTAKTVLGNYHIQNGGGPGNDNSNQAAITFQGGTATEAQAGIYVLNNGSYGTSMGFAVTESYATGPQLFMTATNGGVVNFPRAVPTYAGTSLVYNSGTWGINVTGSSRSLLFSGDSAKAFLDGLWAGGGSYPGYQFTGGNSRFGFSSTSGVIDVYADGNFYATDNSHLVWHAGNLTNLNQLSNGPGYVTQSTGDGRYLMGTTNPGSVNNFTISIGNNGSYSYVQSHSGQPLELNPVGNTVRIAGQTVIHSGNIGSQTVLNSTQLNGLSAIQLFNNMGNNHTTYTDANSMGGYGARYLQGSTNSPNTGSTQYYGFTLGLGNDYSYGTYASQFYWNRTATGGNPYVSVRFQEGGSWGGWSKIYAGYADSAGSASSATTASTLSNNATISGLNFGGVLALTGSGATTSNSTGARLSESYGPMWNLSNGATWHHQVINGSYLCGISAAGGNYGNGNYYGSGDVTAYYSDERLKTKITGITDAIKKIMSLEGFVYVENDLARSFGYTNEREQAGVSAQQIQAVLPQAVSLAPFDMQGVPETGEIISKSGDNYLTVKYDRIVPLLIEGIKEQQAQIEAQGAQITELMTIIKTMKGL